jgi:hypothetical protein
VQTYGVGHVLPTVAWDGVHGPSREAHLDELLKYEREGVGNRRSRFGIADHFFELSPVGSMATSLARAERDFLRTERDEPKRGREKPSERDATRGEERPKREEGRKNRTRVHAEQDREESI